MEPETHAPARAPLVLHTAALVAFAADALIFTFAFKPLGATGQYLARAGAAALIATALLLTKKADLRTLGLCTCGFVADLRWLAKVVAVLMAVSVVLIAAAVGAIRIFHVPTSAWLRLESSDPHLVLNSLLLAPLIEEFVYRSLMVPGLREAHGKWMTIALGALVFYTLHLVYGQPMWMIHYLIGGAILTWAFIARNKLWICVVLHAGGNVLVLADDALYTWYPQVLRAIFGSI